MDNWAQHNMQRMYALLSCPCYFRESADGRLPSVGNKRKKIIDFYTSFLELKKIAFYASNQIALLYLRWLEIKIRFLRKRLFSESNLLKKLHHSSFILGYSSSLLNFSIDLSVCSVFIHTLTLLNLWKDSLGKKEWEVLR